MLIGTSPHAMTSLLAVFIVALKSGSARISILLAFLIHVLVFSRQNSTVTTVVPALFVKKTSKFLGDVNGLKGKVSLVQRLFAIVMAPNFTPKQLSPVV